MIQKLVNTRDIKNAERSVRGVVPHRLVEVEAIEDSLVDAVWRLHVFMAWLHSRTPRMLRSKRKKRGKEELLHYLGTAIGDLLESPLLDSVLKHDFGTSTDFFYHLRHKKRVTSLRASYAPRCRVGACHSRTLYPRGH